LLKFGQGHMSIELDNIIHALRSFGPVFFLDSQSAGHPSANCSYLAALPEVFFEAKGDEITISKSGEKTQFQANPWKAFSYFQQNVDDWLFGFLGYDLKNWNEHLVSENNDSLNLPDLLFFVPKLVLKVDPESQDIEIVKGDLPIQISLDFDVEQELAFDEIQHSVSREEYLQMIRKAQKMIYEGEFYEINLSHQIKMDFLGDPYALYARMKKHAPVPFGAFASLDDYAICCMSPERFLSRKGNRIFSQPIKGTRGRSADAKEDHKLIKELADSEKEKAENLMIVDLVRNDFNRVAVPGTVQVSNLFEIQSFGTVHQMVSSIQAEVQDTIPVEIIKNCFPMGSMTGAPKISAMKSIEKLENYKRGIYSGAIGYFNPKGDFDFNVVIRTALIKNDTLYYSAGGAITSDSDPEKEWEETLTKTEALTNIIK